MKREREAVAQAYFRKHAADWDRIRSLYVAEEEVEGAMSAALGPGPFPMLVDLGTGTGRMLELFADRFERGLGLDVNQSMLAYARSKLKTAGPRQRRGPPRRHLRRCRLPTRSVDAVVMHQVLHYLSEPALAISEAARVLAPGGRLLIVDFAPHEVEELRAHHAHERLGFARAQVSDWLRDAGLDVVETRDLAPAGGDGRQKLTVAMWLAERSPAAHARRARHPVQRQLEGLRP